MTPEPDERASFRRIYILMACLGVLGMAACALWKGFQGAASFASGAAISLASFLSLQQLSPVLTGKAGGARLLFLSFRMLLLFGFAYAILQIYEGFLPATACGLLLAVAAVTLEAIYQLIYARA